MLGYSRGYPYLTKPQSLYIVAMRARPHSLVVFVETLFEATVANLCRAALYAYSGISKRSRLYDVTEKRYRIINSLNQNNGPAGLYSL